MRWRKVPVAVYLEIDEIGGVIPEAIEWDDGRLFEVDRVLEVTHAVSQRVGGFGIRYTVRIRGKEAYLYDHHDRWFMEGCDREADVEGDAGLRPDPPGA